MILDEGQVLTLGKIELQVLHTPGHSPGSICLYSEMESIHRLLALPGETTVYPGHGPATTIGRERRSNPFLS